MKNTENQMIMDGTGFECPFCLKPVIGEIRDDESLKDAAIRLCDCEYAVMSRKIMDGEHKIDTLFAPDANDMYHSTYDIDTIEDIKSFLRTMMDGGITQIQLKLELGDIVTIKQDDFTFNIERKKTLRNASKK